MEATEVPAHETVLGMAGGEVTQASEDHLYEYGIGIQTIDPGRKGKVKTEFANNLGIPPEQCIAQKPSNVLEEVRARK